MKRNEFPTVAFAHVDGDVRLLLHHDPARVRNGIEHDTVDPLLLLHALEAVEIIPVAGGEPARDEIRRHLRSHSNVVLWSNPDTSGLPIALQDQLRDYAFFKAQLTGANEVPPVTTEARGCLYASLDKRTRELSWYGYHLDLSGTETAAHFHVGMDDKVGDITVTVEVGNPKVGSVILSEEQVKQLFNGAFYFNVHSVNYPVGEIRGRVVPAAISRSNNAILTRQELIDIGRGKKLAINPKVVDSQGGESDLADFLRGSKDFPDSSFAIIEKNGSGKIITRSLPYKDAAGKVDLVALRAALTQSVKVKDTKIRAALLRVLLLAAKSAMPHAKFVKRVSKTSEVLAEIDAQIAKAKEDVIPSGTEVRPGILQTGDKNAGTLENGSISPPKERDPKVELMELEPAGENGAIYSKDKKVVDKSKKDEKNKKKKKGMDWAGYSVDFGKALVNVVVDPNEQPLSNETQDNVRDTGNPTGVASPPPVEGAISVSNLDDPSNADLKNAVDSVAREGQSARPGEGSIKLRERIISLLSDKNFKGRVVIFPVTGSEKDEFKVLKIEAAPKTTKSINDLPDSSFAVIERGGKKDDGGKTAPRNYRHLPYKDASGKVDLPHLRNALARMNQVKAVSPKDSTERIRRVARSVLMAAAKKHLPNSKFAKSSQFRISEMLAEVDAALATEILIGKFGQIEAQLIEVVEQRGTKLYQLKMGNKDNPTYFYVSVTYDGDGNASAVVFDYSSYLPAEVADDFGKFLKQLPKKG